MGIIFIVFLVSPQSIEYGSCKQALIVSPIVPMVSLKVILIVLLRCSYRISSTVVMISSTVKYILYSAVLITRSQIITLKGTLEFVLFVICLFVGALDNANQISAKNISTNREKVQ